MSDKDFYEVLGVDRNASPEEIKKLTANSQLSIIQTKIQEMLMQKRNLKRFQMHLRF